MKVFMAEDNVCAQNILKLVSHGNAVISEILRLKDHIPCDFMLKTKDVQQKFEEVIMDFGYFKNADAQENKIVSNERLQELDDDLKEKHSEIVTRFYMLFENIYQYVIDLNNFIEQLNDNVFIQQSIETILKDVEGKQLLCESLYLYGCMLLLCDLYIPGVVRERLLVAFYRYSTSQSQSNVDQVCKLLRSSGYDQVANKKPNHYPVEYFSRIPINNEFLEQVIGKLRSEDIYNQLNVYTIPEHRSAALATQASMLFVCLFFCPEYLHNDTTKLREIADKFFPSNWIVSVYMGVTMNVIDYWDGFKAAKTAINNTCNTQMVKEIFSKRGDSVSLLIEKTQYLLREGILTNDFVLDNTSKILNLLINSNFVLRWLLLHNTQVTFFDNNKKSKQMKDLVHKETNYNGQKLLDLLISTAELELKVREKLNVLYDKRNEFWEQNINSALESINNLSQLLSESRIAIKIPEREQLKMWFDNIAKQIDTIKGPIATKAMKKITQIIQALNEVEDFHSIKSTSTVMQYLAESKESLKNALRVASLKEEQLITLEVIADFSYAWCIIDSYTKYMQDSIKQNPSITSRLRALFLKLASAMEIPLLRINQARSQDLISVSQYYSNELINYIQKVLQIVPEMVFSIVEKIIELQTWHIKEVPTRLDKDKLRDFAQLDARMEVARLTHLASTFTTGILDMSSTLVGVIEVDPAELLETGIQNELAKHLRVKFNELSVDQSKKGQQSLSLQKVQKLAENMDGYKRSLEYIQDYINVHGLKIWQKQVSQIINESVSAEIGLRKGVSLSSAPVGFMGNLARQLLQTVDARTTTYVKISTAWYDNKTQSEIVNTKTFAQLNDAISAVGLHGLDTLYCFMIKYQIQHLLQAFRTDKLPKINFNDSDMSPKDVEQVVMKCNKVLLSYVDGIAVLGSLQMLRKHLAYQLNTICKFDSADLEATLTTFNESLLNELKSEDLSETSPKVETQLLKHLDEHLTRCGIYNPYDKVYIKTLTNMNSNNTSNVLAMVLISLLNKMQLCYSTGDVISKKSGDLDPFPLLTGIYTLLRNKSNSGDHLEEFINTFCQYLKCTTLCSLNLTEAPTDGLNIMRILEFYCENMNYEYSKLEDKLPASFLAHMTLECR